MQMKMLRKVITCESLENFQENIYDEVYFSKGLQLYKKQTSTLIFSKYVTKISCLKNNILRKSLKCFS